MLLQWQDKAEKMVRDAAAAGANVILLQVSSTQLQPYSFLGAYKGGGSSLAGNTYRWMVLSKASFPRAQASAHTSEPRHTSYARRLGPYQLQQAGCVCSSASLPCIPCLPDEDVSCQKHEHTSCADLPCICCIAGAV